MVSFSTLIFMCLYPLSTPRLLGLFLAFPLFAGATTYYVNVSSGSDTNTGLSTGQAFRTIQTAAIKPDVTTVRIAPGVYRETISPGKNGILFEPISVNPNNPVIITGTDKIASSDWNAVPPSEANNYSKGRYTATLNALSPRRHELWGLDSAGAVPAGALMTPQEMSVYNELRQNSYRTVAELVNITGFAYNDVVQALDALTTYRRSNFKFVLKKYSDGLASQVFYNQQMMLEARFPNTPITRKNEQEQLPDGSRGYKYTKVNGEDYLSYPIKLDAQTGSGTNSRLASGFESNVLDEAAYNGLSVTKPDMTGVLVVHENLKNQIAGLDRTKINVNAGKLWVGRTFTIRDVNANDGKIYFDHNYDLYQYVPSPRTEKLPASMFFVYGNKKLLDTEGEWFLENNQIEIWTPGGARPSHFDESTSLDGVEVKTRRNAFDLSGLSNITINNITLFAATIITDNDSRNCTLDNLKIWYASHFMDAGWLTGYDLVLQNSAPRYLDAGIVLRGQNNKLLHSTLTYAAGNGISIAGINHEVSGNTISHINYSGGGGIAINTGGGEMDSGMWKTSATNVIISNNTIDYCGLNGINATGLVQGTIERNSISRIGLQGTDVSAIYAGRCNGGAANETYYGGDLDPSQFTKINGNDIFDADCGSVDSGIVDNNAKGVYLDDGARNFHVERNFIRDVRMGIIMNQKAAFNEFPAITDTANIILNNIVIGNNFGFGWGTNNPMTGATIRGNLFVGSSTFGTTLTTATVDNLAGPRSWSEVFMDPDAEKLKYDFIFGSPVAARLTASGNTAAIASARWRASAVASSAVARWHDSANWESNVTPGSGGRWLDLSAQTTGGADTIRIDQPVVAEKIVLAGLPPTASKKTLTWNAEGAGSTGSLELSGVNPSIYIYDQGITLDQCVPMVGTSSWTKVGAGTLKLANTNTYTGETRLNGGVTEVATVANTAARPSSGLGAGAAALVFTGNATLTYTGVSETSLRPLRFSSPRGGDGTLNVSSAGTTLTWNGTVTGDPASAFASKLTLTGAGNGELSGVITDGQKPLSLKKDGSGTWTLSATNLYTGSTEVVNGSLVITQAEALSHNQLRLYSRTSVVNGSPQVVSGRLALNCVGNVYVNTLNVVYTDTIGGAAVSNNTLQTPNSVENTNKWTTNQAVKVTAFDPAILGLAKNSVYYIIRVTPTSIKLASTLENAGTGIAMTVTGNGSVTLETDKKFASGTYTSGTHAALISGTGSLIVGINQVSQVNQGVGLQGFSVNENTSREVPLRQTDEDGDRLKYSFERNSAGMNPFAAYLGTVELLGDTSFRYTPANKLTGTDEIRGTVTDAKGATLPVRIFITVTPNVVPVAIAPSSSVKQSGGSSQVITLDASDANGDVITYKISNAPSHGTVTIVGNIATYVRNSTYFGADSFTFVANDGQEDSLPVTVVIHPDHFTSSFTSGNFSDPIWGADNEAPQVLGAPEYRLTFNAGTSATLNNDLGAFEFNEMRFSGNASRLNGLAIKAAGVTSTLFVDTASPVVLNTGVIVPAGTTLALKGTGTGNLTLAGVVSGLGSIRKETLGTLTLPVANPSFTGGLTITRGTVQLQQSVSAGTGTITLASTSTREQCATLNLSSPSGGTLVNNLVVDQTKGRNSLTATGSHELSGPVTIRGGSIFTVNRQSGPGSLRISGNVTGDGEVMLSLRSGGGELSGTIGLSNPNSRLDVNDPNSTTFWTLSGTGSNWGQTNITNKASLRLGATNALSTNALLKFEDSSEGGLDLAGWNQTLGGLSSQGPSTKVYNSSTTRDAMLTLDVSVGVPAPVFSGQLRDRLDTPSSPVKRLSLTLSKGSQTLAGTNTYTGNTVINAGTLTVDKSGQLTFRVVNPSVSGTTTMNITGAGQLAFNGRLAVDTRAVTASSGTWRLITRSTAARATYAPTFVVGGSGGETWTKDTTGNWRRSEGKRRWVFNAGVLTLTTVP